MGNYPVIHIVSALRGVVKSYTGKEGNYLVIHTVSVWKGCCQVIHRTRKGTIQSYTLLGH